MKICCVFAKVFPTGSNLFISCNSKRTKYPFARRKISLRYLCHWPKKHNNNRAVMLALCFHRAERDSLFVVPVAHRLPSVSTKHCYHHSNIYCLSLQGIASPTPSALHKDQHTFSLPRVPSQRVSLSQRVPSPTLWPLTYITDLPPASLPYTRINNCSPFFFFPCLLIQPSAALHSKKYWHASDDRKKTLPA